MYKATGDLVCAMEKFSNSTGPVANSIGQGSHSWLNSDGPGASMRAPSYASVEGFSANPANPTNPANPARPSPATAHNWSRTSKSNM